MVPASLPFFLVCAFLAEIIGTMAGFGAATVLTPIAGLFMDIKTAVAIVACFHLFGNTSRLYFFGKHIRWPMVVQFGVIGVACSFAGAKVADALPAPQIRMALGGFLLVYVALETMKLTSMRVPAGPATLMTGGAFSGFIAGIIGTGGAIRSVCLLAFGLPKEAYLGTSAFIALIVDATRVPVYLSQGFIPAAMVPTLAGLMVVAFAGSWAGQRLIRHVPPTRFKQLVLLMLALMGCKFVWDGWRGLA